jgi:hypothetical protein
MELFETRATGAASRWHEFADAAKVDGNWRGQIASSLLLDNE